MTTWFNELADAAQASDAAKALLPTLKQDQAGDDTAYIPKQGLTDDDKENFDTIAQIDVARDNLKSSNKAAPTTSSNLVPYMNNNHLVLTLDSTPKDITPTKKSLKQSTAAIQQETL